MKIYQILVLLFLFLVLVWDWIFLDRAYQKVLKYLLLFLFAVGALFFNVTLVENVQKALQLSRISDFVTYIVTILFVREIVLTRVRLRKKNMEITRIVREIAKMNAIEIPTAKLP